MNRDWEEGYAKGRAEERALYQGRRDDMMRALSEELLHVHTKTLDDLRAKAKKLPIAHPDDPEYNCLFADDVMALFDGSSDGDA